jgi:hypothetical protein
MDPDMTTRELPVLPTSTATSRKNRDLARGWHVVLFWAGPVAWIIIASSLGVSLPLSFALFGVLLIMGTLWLGGLCLVNALRCGRAHCRVDGVLLPILAVVGGLNVLAVIHLAWATYLTILWVIVLASICLECVIGSYPTPRAS